MNSTQMNTERTRCAAIVKALGASDPLSVPSGVRRLEAYATYVQALDRAISLGAGTDRDASLDGARDTFALWEVSLAGPAPSLSVLDRAYAYAATGGVL